MEGRKGTQMKDLFDCRHSFYFGCIVFFMVVADLLLVGASDTDNRNLSGSHFLDEKSSRNSSITDGNDSCIFRRINALLKTQRRIAKSEADSVTLPVEQDANGVFVVKLGLGTPPQTITFSIKPLLDVSWTQCRACVRCKNEEERVFDPSKSSTFRNVSCNSELCTKECWDESSCLYRYDDADLTSIKGGLSTETLTLKKKEVIAGFMFGCGTDNKVAEYAEGVDGYFGLGSGPQSFLSTTTTKFNNSLSYCLPVDNSSSGFLSLGGDGNGVASKSAQFVPFSKSVPISTNIGPTNYAVDLMGISVDGEPLSIGLSASNPLPIILSSNTLTRFPSEIYTLLRDDIVKRMSKYPILRESRILHYDTCFDFSRQTKVSVPAIDFTFSNGVVIPLAKSGILKDWNSTVSCLAFSGNGDDGAIFGTTQQKTFEIIYDNPKERIGFGKDGCSADRSFDTIAVSAVAPSTLPSAAALVAWFVFAIVHKLG